MADIKTADLAKKYGITQKALRLVIEDAGFDIRKNAKTIPGEFVEDLEVILSDKEMINQATKDKPKEEESNAIEIPETISIVDFAKELDKPIAVVMTVLIKNGFMLNQNALIDFETAEMVAMELTIEIAPMKAFAEKKREEMDVHMSEMTGKDVIVRAPVISIMGHVDHGKTSLLDKIRSEDVASGEAGGITQSIGAYQITKNGKLISFLDTPGHEAFTEMRARGAQATDIAVLVVAADDGVMPQTKESISHAKAAGVPIIVAVNKIDKAGANMERILGELAEEGLTPEDWGGDTIVKPVSAITGQGIEELEEAILLVAEMLELKANPNVTATGIVIEAHKDIKLGSIATLLVKNGTLKKADALVAGIVHSKVRTMINDKGQEVEEATPSTPVMISGFSDLPRAGEVFEVCTDISEARLKAETLESEQANSLKNVDMSLARVAEKIREGEINDLKIVLKADSKGSLEALKRQISALTYEKVTTHVINGGVGPVTNGDILMAKASGAIIIAFNVSTNTQVESHAESEGVIINHYDVIYHIVDDLKVTLQGLLKPELEEFIEATCIVKAIFFHGKKELIVGLGVTKGTMKSKLTAKVYRKGELVGQGKISELKRARENVKEVSEGNECGITFSGKFLLEEGDTIEAISLKERVSDIK